MKLRYKFFIAFLTTSCLIVVLLIGIMQFFVYRNFADFVNQTELAKLDDLVNALAEDYQKNNGWDSFKQNPRYFVRILDQTLPNKNDKGHRPPHLLSEFREMQKPERRSNKRPDRQSHFRPPPPPPPDQSNPGTRLCLFDINKEYVAGPIDRNDKFTFREITANNNIIGWLGLKIVSDIRHPLEAGFFKAQKKAFYIMGAGIFILAVFISFLLSRHLLAPIRELVKGTKAMTSFDFDTRIIVNSKDELGRLAADFNNMAKTLKHYEKIRKSWISDISHELRTPISILKGKVEAFQDGIRKVTPDSLSYLHNDIIRLEKLVEDLHLLSLADSENILIRKKKIQPLKILKATLGSFQLRLEKQSINVQTDLSADSDFSLFGSKEQIERLFSNLIENTLRYTDSPGELAIAHSINEEWFKLYFEDSSPGVPDDSLSLIFNRLYRAEKSRNRALGGSGLGLSICKQIVVNHNGVIMSDHSKQGGLKITIKLPLRKTT